MSDITLSKEIKYKYINYYKCPNDGEEQIDMWDSMCNDRCPECNAEIEPYDSTEIN